MTTDGFGQLLWSGDLEGNSQIFVRDIWRRRNVGFAIEAPAPGTDHELLVTSHVDALDINFLPEKRMRFSPGAQGRTTFTGRDVLGRVVDFVGEDGSKSQVRFNLVSDVAERCESTDNGQICTTFEFDRQGRPLSLLDPSGTETLFEYSDFGELMVRARDVTGGGAPYERFEYDDFGRIAKIIDGDGDFRSFTYDSDTGDLIADQANTGGQILYEYDPLGRLAEATRQSPLDNNSGFRSNTGFTRSVTTVNSFIYDHLGRVVEEEVEIGGVELGSIERVFAFKYGGTTVTTELPYRAENRIYDGLGRLRQVKSAGMGVDIALDWVGARFAGREHHPGHFREDRRRGAFGELEQIEFRGVDPDLVAQRPGRNWKDDYCNVGQYQGGWDPDKCMEPMIAVDFIRDHVGRITDRTTTYGFPNGFDRDGSEFETTSFSYAPRGFLHDFESVGELLTGNFTDGHDYVREPALGSTEHLYEFGGGAPLWSGLRNPDGRLTNLMTDNYSWSFDYDTDGKMVEYADFELEYDQWKNIVAVHDTDTGQDFAESYIYDFAGRLVGTVSPLRHIDMWIHDGRNPVERWTASNQGSVGSAHIMGEYTWGQTPNQMLAARTKESGHQLVVPLTDERQSIIGIFNEDKLLVDEYAAYDPDDRIRIRDNQDTVVCSEREMQEEPCHFDDLPRFGFTGAYRSTVTGLTKMGARWYSAQIGQFITPDPLWYIDSFDLYAYAGFDPVNRWDPTGLASAGLGNVFRQNEPRSSLADQFRPDRGAQFDGLTGSLGYRPDRDLTRRPPGDRGGRGNSSSSGGVGGPPNPALGGGGGRAPAELLPGYQRRDGVSRARVSRDGNDIQIGIRFYFRSPVGVEITNEMIVRWTDAVESDWTGRFGRYNVVTTVIASRGRPILNILWWRGHQVNVYQASSRQHRRPRRALFNLRTGDIAISANASGAVFSHEAGHALGAGDRYFSNNHPSEALKGKPWPGWEGNIMTTAPNTGEGHVWEENIVEILETHNLVVPGDYQ